MRLGIRRKLIGTLMLVGLLPLALSLVVILGGGATMRLHSISNTYEHKAINTANQVADIFHNEIVILKFIAQLPQTRNLALQQQTIHAQRRAQGLPPTTQATTTLPQPDNFTRELDQRWPKLTPQDAPVRNILNNPLADQLVLLAALDGHNRQLLVTDAFGELIATNVKTGDYYQADEEWWQQAYAKGKGQIFISTVEPNPATGTPVVSLAVPVYDVSGLHLIGILKNKIDVAWLRQPLQEITPELEGTTSIMFDERLGRAVLRSDDSDASQAAEKAYLLRGDNEQQNLLGVIFGELIMGSAKIPLDQRMSPNLSVAQAPHWAIIVSKPAQEAMTPIYKLAFTVAAIGIALILVLFILGVAIANREIIIPIIRLREATAAVARGELNVRLMSDLENDPTFRSDELGELAIDFDNMTRELQKSVGQLHRSAESRQRFMELAGHELRTPVTYILGVCQLTLRQLQALNTEGTPLPTPTPETPLAMNGDAETPTLATNANGNPNAATALAMAKVIAKAQRLTRIIDNLLKLVNNEQFTTRLIKQPVDLRAIILHVCNDNRPFVNERHQNLICDIPDSLPILEGDPDKLEDAFTNLLSNAIRFSPDSSTIKVAARAVVGDMLEILVEDAGPGISSAEATNLFEPFYTGTDIMHHHSGTIEYGSKGIGLGLAIVRRFVEIHGGVVRAHTLTNSLTGKISGTQFQILLPLPPSANTLRARKLEATGTIPAASFGAISTPALPDENNPPTEPVDTP